MSESPREPERHEATGSTPGPADELPTTPAAEPAAVPAFGATAGLAGAGVPTAAGAGVPTAAGAGVPTAAGTAEERQRRRRRFFVAGIVAGAAVIVVALCAGLLAVVSAVDGVRDRAGDAREARRLRDADCRRLEQRLNRLIPPGATTGPAARATAVRDEDSAVRLYVGVLHHQRDEDGWRQLLDARTVYADALDRQAKSRTPAFYVPPQTADGIAVTDDLERWSPATCAGPLHRLAVPDL